MGPPEARPPRGDRAPRVLARIYSRAEELPQLARSSPPFASLSRPRLPLSSPLCAPRGCASVGAPCASHLAALVATPCKGPPRWPIDYGGEHRLTGKSLGSSEGAELSSSGSFCFMLVSSASSHEAWQCWSSLGKAGGQLHEVASGGRSGRRPGRATSHKWRSFGTWLMEHGHNWHFQRHFVSADWVGPGTQNMHAFVFAACARSCSMSVRRRGPYTFSDCMPFSSQIGLTPVSRGSNLAVFGPKPFRLGRIRANCAHSGGKVDQHRPVWPGIDRRPTVGKLGPNSANFDQTWHRIGQTRPDVYQIRPGFGRSRARREGGTMMLIGHGAWSRSRVVSLASVSQIRCLAKAPCLAKRVWGSRVRSCETVNSSTALVRSHFRRCLA